MIGLLLAIIYCAYISLGLPDSLVSCAWVEMYKIFGVDVSSLGIITMLIAGSTIISSLVADQLSLKLGPGLVSALSTILVALTMFLFSITTKFYVVCLLAIPYGFGAGAIDTSLNNYAALHYPSRCMSFLHAFWGIGAIISPYIMGYALVNKGYPSGFIFVGIVQLILGILFLFALPIWKKAQKINIDSKEEVTQLKLTFKEKFHINGIMLLLIAFFAENAIENTLIQWIPTYLKLTTSINSGLAANISSLFFIGMTLSRIIVGIFGSKLQDKTMIRWGLIITATGIVVLAIPFGNLVFTYISIGIIGLGIGPVFPAFVHSTPTNFGKDKSLAVIGLQFAFGYIGSTFVPPIYGLLINLISPSIFPYFLMFFLILTIVLSEILFNQFKNKHL